jgi:hypothetical protein
MYKKLSYSVWLIRYTEQWLIFFLPASEQMTHWVEHDTATWHHAHHLIIIVPNSTQQYPSWDANSRSTGQ